jgi:hypothetical protein
LLDKVEGQLSIGLPHLVFVYLLEYTASFGLVAVKEAGITEPQGLFSRIQLRSFFEGCNP